MDLELRCPLCENYYQSPIYLPCSHSLCYSCALSSVRNKNNDPSSQSTLNLSYSSDLDQLSFHSDNDSGVIVQRSSSSSSVFLPPALPEISTSTIISPRISSTCFILCPVCTKSIHFESICQVKQLPLNRLLNEILQRYRNENSSKNFKCQLCSPKSDELMTTFCEQCRVGYCDRCREQYHPMRGPFATHQFISPFHSDEAKLVCRNHRENLANFFCLYCRVECCENCSLHIEHEIVSIGQAAKQSKTNLSTQLQNLSEKAKHAADFLKKLKFYPDYIKKNGEIFQEKIIDEINEIIMNLEKKKSELIDLINSEVERKLVLIEKQYSSYNEHIQRTTGFLQFSIEALKQNDAGAFLQVFDGLNDRCSTFIDSFSNDYECKGQTSYEIELQFNTDHLYREMNRLKFQQIKPPSTPRFLAEQCFCRDSSSGVLTWSIDDIGSAQGFILELDNGNVNSDFREVYDGRETMCAVDGLLPSNVYTARVKSYNQAGESAFSQCITLHSSSISSSSSFTFNPRMTHPDIEFFSSICDSITSVSLQERVALGSRAFRQGIHYWEYLVQRYDGQPDPAFGIARFDVSKENMLGKDSKSWCMYIDSERSWFMHNGQHTNRLNGGIRLGSIIGVLLNLNDGTLRFFIDRHSHGPVAFTNLKSGDVFYPAVSLNKNVHLTLISGLQPPPSLSCL